MPAGWASRNGVQDRSKRFSVEGDDGGFRGAAAAASAPQRHQNLARHGISGTRHIGGRDRVAVHINAGSQIRPVQPEIAGTFDAIMEQCFGRIARGDSGIPRRSRCQCQPSPKHGSGEFFVILLRLLHCNIPKYFVTELPKHSINKPLKNSLKRVVAKAAKFGDEIRREAGLKAGSNPAFSFFGAH